MNLALTPTSSSLLLLALPAASLAADASASSTCDCQPFPPEKSSYQSTRLWSIVDPSLSDQDVIKEFNDGFAPAVTYMSGFQRYMALSTGNSSTVFFLNQFDTQEEAHLAQEAAKEFVAKNEMLNGRITPNIFTEAQGFFAAPRDTGINSSSKGDYLNARFFNFVDPASANVTKLYSIAETYYKEVLQDAEGFVTYYIASYNDNNNTAGQIAWDIFQTEEMAIQNKEKPNNFSLPDWAPPAKRIGDAAGIIAFDYTCIAGNRPAAPTPSSDTSSAAAILSTSAVSATAIFMMLWKVII